MHYSGKMSFLAEDSGELVPLSKSIMQVALYFCTNFFLSSAPAHNIVIKFALPSPLATYLFITYSLTVHLPQFRTDSVRKQPRRHTKNRSDSFIQMLSMKSIQLFIIFYYESNLFFVYIQ